jgi:hypothetical protein
MKYKKFNLANYFSTPKNMNNKVIAIMCFWHTHERSGKDPKRRQIDCYELFSDFVEWGPINVWETQEEVIEAPLITGNEVNFKAMQWLSAPTKNKP